MTENYISRHKQDPELVQWLPQMGERVMPHSVLQGIPCHPQVMFIHYLLHYTGI